MRSAADFAILCAVGLTALLGSASGFLPGAVQCATRPGKSRIFSTSLEYDTDKTTSSDEYEVQQAAGGVGLGFLRCSLIGWAGRIKHAVPSPTILPSCTGIGFPLLKSKRVICLTKSSLKERAARRNSVRCLKSVPRPCIHPRVTHNALRKEVSACGCFGSNVLSRKHRIVGYSCTVGDAADCRGTEVPMPTYTAVYGIIGTRTIDV